MNDLSTIIEQIADRPVIVTGQQAGLFGGPLYTLYKYLGAIAVAEAEDGVAVFWIECDDADVREVDRATVLAPGGRPRTVTLGADDDGRPVAGRQLGDQIDQVLAELAESLPATDSTAAALDAIRACHRPESAWQHAFAEYLARLLAPRPARLFDPTSADAKRAAAPIFARVLEQWEAVDQALTAGAVATSSPQVPHVPGELPLFVLDDDGTRRRLVKASDGFLLKGTDRVATRAELEAMLQSRPERFSPNVLLRPVVQDSLFRTRAHVAGPAEARYHAQLDPLYQLFELERPRLLPRPRFTLLEPRVRRALEKLGVTADEALTMKASELLRRSLERRGEVAPEQEAEVTQAIAMTALDDLGRKLLPIDPGLAKSIDEARRKISYQLQRLGRRASDALARREQQQSDAAERVAWALLPNGEPQERVYGPLQALTRIPAAELVELLLARIDVKELGRHQVVELP